MIKSFPFLWLDLRFEILGVASSKTFKILFYSLSWNALF